MAWRCSGRSNEELVRNLRTMAIIKSENVFQAMLAVDRAEFSPSAPYNDAPQPIGHNMTISAPHMHAFALEYLKDFLIPGIEPVV